MRRKLLTLSLGAGLLAGAVPASAQTKPYALRSWTEVGLTATAAGIVAGAIVWSDSQEPHAPAEIVALDPGDINSFDRSATKQWSPNARSASDVFLLGLLASPLTFAASEPGRVQSVTLGVMYVETIVLTSGVTQLLKGAANRTRPYAYNSDPVIPDEDRLDHRTRRSFPSGHTSMAFAAAVFLSTTYSRLHPNASARKWVWIGSLTAAGTVGYLRYGAGQHFPTDIIAGAAIGASIGYLVPKLHETGPVYVAPADGGLALGAVLQF